MLGQAMGKVKESQATYVVDRRGRKTAVILRMEEYERLLEDLADLSAIAKRKKENSVGWEQVKKRLKRVGFVVH